jgi:hypothetical protein
MSHETTGTQQAPRPAAEHPTPAIGDGVVGVAYELPWHRRYSPIGGGQRHYRLDPMLLTDRAVCGDGVVVVIGAKSAYAFPADSEGQIADYIPVAEAPGATTGADVLALLGYTVDPRSGWAA